MLNKSAAGGSRLDPDVLTGIAVLVFCTLVYLGTTTFDEVPAMLSQNVPPTFFPRVVLAALAVLGLILAGTGWKRTEPPKERERLRPSVFVTGAIFTLAVALVSFLGMIPTAFLISILLPLYWGERRMVLVVLLAVGLPLAIHLLFTVALGMRFPQGAIW